MDGETNRIQEFFHQLWSFVVDKHNQGVYNTICLGVLLTLPLLILFTTLIVCCHCCCCRHDCSCCCCCKRRKAAMRSQTKKKKSSASAEEDLWISVKTGPMTPDRVNLTMV
ncbi:uncharacterized protein KIAA0040 homolog [Antennarius striatus]|uniref:uncharacterized protein KIAA0040 homolog n=1 Tax=Antennarius striatus TaxID=241820 RepID=UPI0035B49333